MSIASDGTVTIVAHRSEMGCGSRTALPLVVADELDADWSKVKIDQAIGDPKYGDQDTDGSHSVRSFFDQMRQVGAAGRAMLISAAAAQWNVSSQGLHNRTTLRRASRQRTKAGIRRAGRCGCETAGPKERRPAAQVEVRVALRREREQCPVRSPRHGYRQSDLRHGRYHAGHGLRLDRTSAGAGAEDQVLRRQSRAQGAGSSEDAHHRDRHAAAPVQATGRSGRDWRQHLGDLQGT